MLRKRKFLMVLVVILSKQNVYESQGNLEDQTSTGPFSHSLLEKECELKLMA